MRHMIFALTGALSLGFFVVAEADDLELSVAVVSTQTQPLRLNDMVHLQVSLKNSADKPLQGLKELTFDRSSVFLELKLGDRTFIDQRIGRSVTDLVQLPKFELAAGASETLEMTLPALQAGPLQVTAVYMGGSARVASGPLALNIEPKNGQKQAQVRIVTNRGAITLKLFPDQALGTCNHFVRHVRQNFYNGSVFHRIIANFMIQAGCPKGDGTGGPGYNIPFEKNDLKHKRGRLAMAKMSHPDSAGSQFYICVGQPRHLDGKHVVFGEVTKGYEVVELHSKAKTAGAARPLEEERIRRITLVP